MCNNGKRSTVIMLCIEKAGSIAIILQNWEKAGTVSD